MAVREVRRRLAAILAADIAGYTQLMVKDTDGSLRPMALFSICMILQDFDCPARCYSDPA